MLKPSLEIEKEPYNIAPTYRKGVTHAITIAPDDIAQLYGNGHKGNKYTLRRANRVVEEMRSLLTSRLAPYAEYTLYTEISKPEVVQGEQSRPRVHFHGTVTFDSPYAWLSDGAHLMGDHHRVHIKTLNHPDKWHTYCTKDAKEMVAYMGRDATIVKEAQPSQCYPVQTVQQCSPVQPRSKRTRRINMDDIE